MYVELRGRPALKDPLSVTSRQSVNLAAALRGLCHMLAELVILGGCRCLSVLPSSGQQHSGPMLLLSCKVPRHLTAPPSSW